MRRSILAGGGIVAVMLAIALIVQQCTAVPAEAPVRRAAQVDG